MGAGSWVNMPLNVPQAVASGTWFDLGGFDLSIDGGVLVDASAAGDNFQFDFCADPNGAAPLSNAVAFGTLPVTGPQEGFIPLQADQLVPIIPMRYIRVRVTAFNTGSAAVLIARRK